ncbi:MAG TPA: DnaB-like helicase C-terminal domain-containing protein [Candidatus Methylomirabilis sp.]|nr:DnaB-like helicase C-terminal domain-containing protein [Candidatus Methylomirabilis sp.]
MAQKRERPSGANLKELLSLETSVLKTLCLTINSAGSVHKDKLLDVLSRDDFYFPIHKALFSILREMQHRGDYIVLANIKEELFNRSVELPEGFYLEDLFRGDLPTLPELNQWVVRLKERIGGASPSVSEAGSEPPAPTPASLAPTPPASEASRGSSGRMDSGSLAAARRGEAPAPGGEAVAGVTRPAPESRRVAPESERSGRSRPIPGSVLASEGDEWTSYLQEVAAKQGRIFETGFAGLDDSMGGLSPGLMLLIDQDHDRLSGFLKQLTDQIAIRSKLPCLYVSFGLSKAALRVWTLARLSGVSARDIEKGRIKKGSPEWERVERNGRDAAEWLKRVFVVEGDADTDLELTKDLGRKLLDSSGMSTCLVLVDGLEKMARDRKSLQAVVTGLKELSDSLDALVIAGTTNRALSSEPPADYFATFGETQGSLQLDVRRVEDSRLATLRFDYQSDIHRFIEKSGS